MSSSNKFKRSLADRIQKNRKQISEWYTAHAQEAPPPIYCSIDLRDSGHKIVPVDSNLYPAGFNNICPEDMRSAPLIIEEQVANLAERRGFGRVQKILILPESHTQNLNYFENLYYLQELFKSAGFDVRIGWYGPLPPGMSDAIEFKSATGKAVKASPIKIEKGVLSIPGFVPELILLNNDFSSGYPKVLDEVTQPIVPSHTLGWHSRKKSDHFKYYNQLASEFAQIVGIDPWSIQIDTEEVGPVNFNEEQGTEQVASSAERILSRTQAQYEAHKISQKPFVFVKNNHGTYGMGIMVVHSAEELRTMNRRTKNKMSVGKNRLPIDSVVVQEGVPTATIVDRLAAEPVIYLCGCDLIGGFLRTNTEKGIEENLNSQGMVFKKLCMSDLRRDDSEDEDEGSEDEPVLELVYGMVAKISALATGMELAHSKPKPAPTPPAAEAGTHRLA